MLSCDFMDIFLLRGEMIMEQKNKSTTKTLVGYLFVAKCLALSIVMFLMLSIRVFAAYEVEPNDSFESATQIMVNELYSGSVEAISDVDYYKFTINKDMQWSIRFSGETGFIDNSDTWMVTVFDEDKHLRLCGPVQGNSSGVVMEYFTISEPGAGTYYFKVYSERNDLVGKPYHIMIDTNGLSDEDFFDGIDRESEMNDSIDTSNEIQLNQSVDGNLSNASDLDYYKVTTIEPGLISFDFCNHSDSEVVLEFLTEDVPLSDPTGTAKKPFFRKYLGYGVLSSGEYGFNAGTYYFRVRSRSNQVEDIRYSLRVKFTLSSEWEFEKNDTIEQANALTLGKEINGYFWSLDDYYDYYKFDVASPGKISLDFSNEYKPTIWCWTVRIIGPSGNVVYSTDIGGTNLNTVSSPFLEVEPGTYYVEIRTGSSDLIGVRYKIKINYNSNTENSHLRWENVDGKSYWYENGIRQGTESDSKCFEYEGTLRGREIYDPKSDGWYWLDVIYGGAKAVGKEVFMPYIYQNEADWSEDDINNNAAASGADADGNIEHAELAEQVKRAIQNKSGKWVRYDNEGKMLKGWVTIEGDLASLYPDQVGNRYYYDHKTGLMAKGWTVIDGKEYYFDETTGVLR